MRKISILFSALTAGMLFFNSCGDVETPVKYITINGTKADLAYATTDDWGTDDDITYRTYSLEFKSANSYTPANYIEFRIYSPSTTRLQEGTYTYEYTPAVSTISYLEIGSNVKYDDGGVAISGTHMTESNSTFSGTVTVSMKDDNYYFVFDLTAEYDGETYTIDGEYNDVLTAY